VRTKVKEALRAIHSDEEQTFRGNAAPENEEFVEKVLRPRDLDDGSTD
jgi:hypothetical protein